MNTQVTETVVNGGTTADAVEHEVMPAAAKRRSRLAPKSKTNGLGKQHKTSKKNQLVALLSKPNGACRAEAITLKSIPAGCYKRFDPGNVNRET